MKYLKLYALFSFGIRGLLIMLFVLIDLMAGFPFEVDTYVFITFSVFMLLEPLVIYLFVWLIEKDSEKPEATDEN